MRYQDDNGTENKMAVVIMCIVFAIAIGGSIWWWMSAGRFASDNPGLSELQSRRAIRGCINGEVWAFVEHGKTLGQVYGQKDGKFSPMECHFGVESDGLLMREVCLQGNQRGAQVLYGPWKNETFLMVSKTYTHGDIEWLVQPCRPDMPAAESFYR